LKPPLSSLGWSPDGKTLASGSVAGLVGLWDVASVRELRRLDAHSGWITSLAWSPDGKTLASASMNNLVRLWDPASGQELRRLEGDPGSEGTDPILQGSMYVAWSPDGKTLAGGGRDESIRLWDVSSGRELRRLEPHLSWVTSLAWSPDGNTLASTGNKVVLWDVATGRELRRLEGHSVAWSPDGKMLAVASSTEQSVRLWDMGAGRELRRVEGYSVAWSPDGKTLASSSDIHFLRLWDAESGRELSRIEGPSARVTWSPDGKMLASGAADGTTRIWEVDAPDAPLVAMLWAGLDGWVAWRGRMPEGHRVLRGENGNLIRRPREDGILEPVVPALEGMPRVSATAEAIRPSGQGRMGEIALLVRNAPGAAPAIWVEAQAPESPPDDSVVIRFPPVSLRVEPGEMARLSLEYVRAVRDNPEPVSRHTAFAIRYAGDRGTPIRVDADLRFQSAKIDVRFERPVRSDEGLTVPVTVSNDGDETTGRNLSMDARFLLPDGSAVDSNFSLQVAEGLPPNATKRFSLTVPKEVKAAHRFRVELMAREGMAAGLAADSPVIGFPSHWTRTSEWLAPRDVWILYGAVLWALVLIAAATYLRARFARPHSRHP